MSLRNHDAGSRHAAGLFSPAAAHRPGDGHALLAPVLVLNASYEPINVCAARRALVLVLKGVAMTEEENGHFLHSARCGDAPALGDPAARVPPHSPPEPRALAQEHPAARPQHLPVLRHRSAVKRARLSTTSFRAPAEAHRPGKTWSPAATPATAARAISILRKPA